MKETKLSLTNKKFKQGPEDSLTLGGTTNVKGTFMLNGIPFILEGLKNGVVFVYDAEKNCFMPGEGGSGSGIEFYDETKSYKMGEVVVYEERLFISQTNGTTPGPFDGGDWIVLTWRLNDNSLAADELWSAEKINQFVDGLYNDLLDRSQDAQTAIVDLQSDIYGIELSIDSLESRLSVTQNDIYNIVDRQDAMQGDIDDLQTSSGQTRDQLTWHQERIDDMDGRIYPFYHTASINDRNNNLPKYNQGQLSYVQAVNGMPLDQNPGKLYILKVQDPSWPDAYGSVDEHWAEIGDGGGITQYDDKKVYNSGAVVVSENLIWRAISDGITGPFDGFSNYGSNWTLLSTVVDDNNGLGQSAYTTLSSDKIYEIVNGQNVDQDISDLFTSVNTINERLTNSVYQCAYFAFNSDLDTVCEVFFPGRITTSTLTLSHKLQSVTYQTRPDTSSAWVSHTSSATMQTYINQNYGLSTAFWIRTTATYKANEYGAATLTIKYI